MATEIFMPTLGMNQETGKLLEWLAAEGQNVTKGQPVMVVETDKATVELEAPATGKLVNVSAQAGDDVPVGQVIALIIKDGEPIPAANKPAVQSTTAAPERKPPVEDRSAAAPAGGVTTVVKAASPLAMRIADEHHVDLSQVPCAGQRIQKEDVLAYLADQRLPDVSMARKTLASPKARRWARENDLDLAGLSGSGPEGAVLAQDVLAAIQARAAAQPEPGKPEIAAIAAGDTLPTSKMWQVMAQRLTESWQTIPHFYLEAEANAAQLKAWRAGLLERLDEKVTFTDLLVKLVSVALRRHARVNASWVNGRVQANSQVNIGLAVAVQDGLLVPVIQNADQLNLQSIAARRKALVAGAQANRLALSELSGGTFTISNLGRYNCIDSFSAIVNPPEAAILALGRIADKIVPVNGQPAVQPMLRMTLSCDHRVIDGTRGAEFLQSLVNLIEDPLSMVD